MVLEIDDSTFSRNESAEGGLVQSSQGVISLATAGAATVTVRDSARPP